jgi:poly-gamma-glutamate synthesis protein (capsule biosynthesis protein)
MTAELTLTAAGDAMIAARMRTFDHPRFDDLVDLVRAADAAPINLEVLLHDFEGYPAANGPGTYMRAPPWAADELSWMGFDIFAAATNHAMDYSHGGMEATMRALEERDIPYAGMGRTLAAAREPAYLDTPAGRVALVAACSTVTTGSVAGEPRHGVQGRPGIAPLRFDTRYRVPEERFEQLREISEELGLERYKRWIADLGFPVADPDGPFRFLNLDGSRHPGVVVGDDYGVERDPDPDDVDALRRQIDAADRQADWVVASLHSHEGDGARSTDETVAPFVEAVARACVDAGADAVLGHGSHTLRGIEIYDGAPIFYSLGNLIAQNELVERLPPEIYDRHGLPAEATPADLFDARNEDEEGEPAGFLGDRGYFETVLPVCEFDEGGLSGLTLHPVDLQMEEPRSRRGRPILADDDAGERILERLCALSAPYGTEIDVGDGRARVVV